jgi:hypothetical protein
MKMPTMSMGARTLPFGDDLAERRQQLREARLKAARTQSNFSEIVPAERLIPRGPASLRLLVDTETDLLWRVSLGNVFLPDGASVAATHAKVTYYVDADGDVVTLERAEPFTTWTKLLERRPDLVKVPAA